MSSRILPSGTPHRSNAKATVAILLLAAPLAQASDYYWDSNGTSLGTGRAGTWDTTSLRWRANTSTGTLSAWPNSATNAVAVFYTNPGIVTVSGTVNINGLKILTAGYSLTGGTLNLVGSSASFTGSSGIGGSISSSITGSASLRLPDSGVFTLSGVNSWTGGTSVEGGNVIFTSSVPSSGTITISGWGTVGGSAYASVNDWLNSGKISTASSLGNIGLTGNSSENVNLATIAGGAYTNVGLAALGGNYTYSGTLTPASNGYFLGGTGGTLTVSSNLSSAAPLTIRGGVVLTGAASVTSVNIAAGNLQLGDGTAGHDGSIPNSANVSLNGNILTFNLAGNQTYSGNITGFGGTNGQVVKSGPGTLTLSGNNGFASATVNDGTLKIGSASALASTSSVIVNGGMLDLSERPTTVAYVSVGMAGGIALGLGNTLTISSTGANNFRTDNWTVSGTTAPATVGSYRLVTTPGGLYATYSGTGNTVLPNPDPENYNVVQFSHAGGNSIDLLHKAVVGTITPSTVSVIAGGKAMLPVSVTNPAPVGSDGLNVTLTATGSGFANGTSGDNLAAGATGNYQIANGFDSTGKSAGAYTGTINALGVNYSMRFSGLDGQRAALNSGAAAAVTVNVLDHASGSFAAGSSVTTLVLDMGTYHLNTGIWSNAPGASGTRSTSLIDIHNLISTPGYTAGLDLTDITIDGTTGDASGLSTTFSPFSKLLADGSSRMTFGLTFDAAAYTENASFSRSYRITTWDDRSLPGALQGQDLLITVNGAVLIPEPSNLAILGLCCLGLVRRRRPRGMHV